MTHVHLQSKPITSKSLENEKTSLSPSSLSPSFSADRFSIRPFVDSDFNVIRTTFLSCGPAINIEYCNHHIQHGDMRNVEELRKTYCTKNDKLNGEFWVVIDNDVDEGKDGRCIGQVALRCADTEKKSGKIYKHYFYPFILAVFMGFYLLQIYEHTGELHRLGVRPEYRKARLGALLLKTLLNFAKEQGFVEVFLTTLRSNEEAIVFYKKYGFVSVDDTIVVRAPYNPDLEVKLIKLAIQL